VRIVLYDVTGRLIRTLVDETLPGGESSWRWDGLDAQGRPAPRGLYFARVVTDQGTATARLLLAR
jgi:flagellar hook assembly protein FlgD